MDARDFLNAIIPWDDEGYTTIHWKRPGAEFLGRSFRSVDAALAFVATLDTGTPCEIYFCLSRQQLNSGKRSRAHALHLNCGWMDADVDPDNPKKYPTLQKAIAAIFYFCQLLELPRPSYMVASGGGVHAYWVSHRKFTVDEWQPYADALKNAARRASLKIDFGVTGDAARVLRVPGTFNWKTGEPRAVRLLETCSTGETYDFASIFAGILTLAPVAHAKPNGKLGELGKVPTAFSHLPMSKLGAGIEDSPPLPLAPILAGCAFLREAHETGGKDFDEPQWNITTLISHFLEDGHELAHQFGNQHPDYEYGQTEAKWERKGRDRRDKNLGWPSCRTISDAGSRHCATCPHFPLGKSPLHFGLPTVESVRDREAEELGGVRPNGYELPKGFCLNQEGQICAIIPGKAKPKGAGYLPTRLVRMMTNVITNPSLQFQNGMFALAFVASTDLGSTHEVVLTSAQCRGTSLLTQLAAKAVSYTFDREGLPYVERLMVSWMDKLMNEQKAIRDSGTLGWRYEDGKKIGFVYGGQLHKIDGTSESVVNASDDEFRRWYMPTGQKEPWLAAANLLTGRKRPELDIIISIAFASPLMAFTGNVYGTMLSTYGEPGTAKSTAQQVAAAVWGNPKQTRESLNSTAKSVQGRLGRTRNLPAYWDDIQDEKHQEALFQTMFVASMGTEGGRLNPDSTYKERKEWQTLLAACSNASFVEFLVKKQKSTTAGMRRVFEFKFDKQPGEPGLVDALDAHKTFAKLEHNYGVVGLEYAKLLVSEHEQIGQKLEEVTRSFKDSVEGTADEDFWWNLCGVLITGASLANRLGADLDLKAMTAFLVQAYLRNRRTRRGEGTEGGSWANTEQSLAAFLNHYTGSGHTIYTNVTFVHRNYPVEILRHPEKNRPVYIQVIRDERKLLISKRKFREYLQENQIQTSQVLEGMKKFFHARESRMTLAAGTVMAQAQEAILEIRIPTGQVLLEDLLTAQGPVSS